MEEKFFDIVDYFKFMYSKKIFIIACVALSLLSAFFYFSVFTKPTYEAVMQVKLPQYCDNKDVFTSIEIAKGDLVQKTIDLITKENERKSVAIQVEAKWVRDTALVGITFRSEDKEILEMFTKEYGKQLVAELNSIVNERFFRDVQVNAVRNDDIPVHTRDFKKDFIVGEVKVVKSAANIEGPIHSGTKRKYVMSGLIGLFAGFFLFSFQFLLKQFRD